MIETGLSIMIIYFPGIFIHVTPLKVCILCVPHLWTNFNFSIFVKRPENTAEVTQHLSAACVGANVVRARESIMRVPNKLSALAQETSQ